MEKILNTILLIVIIILLLILIEHAIKLIVFIRKKRAGKKRAGKKEKEQSENKIGKFISMISDLPEKLKKLQDYKTKADNYDTLEQGYKDINTEKETLLKQKTDLKIQLTNVQQKLQTKDQEVSTKLQAIENQNHANKELLNKIKKAEHLKDYAGQVSEYIGFLENILNDSNNDSNKESKNNEESAKIISALLQQALLKTTSMSKWKYMCEDIKENGIAVLNKILKNCFQKDDEKEQSNEFKKKCLSELRTYTNAVLILCESCANLSRFLESGNASSIESEFKKKIAEIKTKAEKVGITEIAEVKIFTNIFNKEVEAISGDISFPYSTVNNLNKDDIAKIVEFGMKTTFEDLNIKKTKVIIK